MGWVARGGCGGVGFEIGCIGIGAGLSIGASKTTFWDCVLAAGELSADKLSVDELSADELSADKLSATEEMDAGKVVVGKGKVIGGLDKGREISG